MGHAHSVEICEKCGSKRNMRQSHIRIKLTCVENAGSVVSTAEDEAEVRTRVCCVAFPAPMIYGAVIDSTCIVLQQSCSRQGACLLYDVDSFRVRLHLLTVAFQLGTVTINALAWYLSCRRYTDNTVAAYRDDTTVDGKAASVTRPDDEKEPLRGVLA